MAPNILWIVTTQWRAQALGYAGDPNARTPALDALAAESVDYTQAVTPHPFGPFARAALFTGVESPENGVRDYFDPLPDDAPTIARAMNARSYETIFFGKWHLAARDRAAPLTGEAHARAIVPPSSRGGFGFWEGFESGFLLNDPWLHGTRLAEPAQFKGYQSSVVCSRALEKIAASRGPWFAVVSLEAPHPPYGAPAEEIRPFDTGKIELRVNVTEGAEARARTDLSGYYAHIEATDRAIGSLVAGLPRETIVVLTSVHGDMHGSHGLFRKGWPHEESVRVPLLVRTGASPRRDDRAISLTDLSSMTLAWAKKGRAAHLPVVESFSRISMPSIVALPDQCDRRWTGLRSSARKLVVGADGEPWLFFDLESDPLELSNLAREPARWDEIDALRRRLAPPAGGLG
jgi:arylsulfatase A-like enzyme